MKTHRLFAPIKPMHLGWMIHLATFGNGSRTVSKIITPARTQTAALGPQEIVRAVFSAAVLGAADPGASVPRNESGAGPTSGTSASASVLQGCSRVSGDLLYTDY